MARQIWFSTSKFNPVPGEEGETNPGRFGKQLADWLIEQLSAKGYSFDGQPEPEDWGWRVTFCEESVSSWIGCANEEGSKTRWGVFVKSESGLFGKWRKGNDSIALAHELECDIESILRDETVISDIEWEGK